MKYRLKKHIDAMYWDGKEKTAYEIIDWLHTFPYIKRVEWNREGQYISVVQEHSYEFHLLPNHYLVETSADPEQCIITFVPAQDFEKVYEVVRPGPFSNFCIVQNLKEIQNKIDSILIPIYHSSLDSQKSEMKILIERVQDLFNDKIRELELGEKEND